MERSHLQVKQAKSEYLPTLNAFARVYADDNRFGYRGDDTNWIVGAVLRWEIFSGPKRKAHRRLAEAKVDENQAADRRTRQIILCDPG